MDVGAWQATVHGDRGVWWAMVHRIAKSQKQLKQLGMLCLKYQ